jgi:hypothetical protein
LWCRLWARLSWRETAVLREPLCCFSKLWSIHWKECLKAVLSTPSYLHADAAQASQARLKAVARFRVFKDEGDRFFQRPRSRDAAVFQLGTTRRRPRRHSLRAACWQLPISPRQAKRESPRVAAVQSDCALMAARLCIFVILVISTKLGLPSVVAPGTRRRAKVKE